MAGIAACTAERDIARQPLGAQVSSSGAPGQVVGGTSGQSGGINGHLRFGVELMVGWITVSLIVAALLAFTETISPEPDPAQAELQYELWEPELTVGPDDTGPSDPLVFCTAFATHTHCIR